MSSVVFDFGKYFFFVLMSSLICPIKVCFSWPHGIPKLICSEEGKVAHVILPLVTLEDQVEDQMTQLGLRFVNLTSTPVELLEEQIRVTEPHVLLGNVESLTSPEIQRKISRLKISYIAVDEAQVSSESTLKQSNIILPS